MLSLVEKYPNCNDKNFFIFLSNNEIQNLEKNNSLEGLIFEDIKTRKALKIVLEKGKYVDEQKEEVYVEQSRYILHIYSQKFNELKKKNWIGGRMNSGMHKYDIYENNFASKISELNWYLNKLKRWTGLNKKH